MISSFTFLYLVSFVFWVTGHVVPSLWDRPEECLSEGTWPCRWSPHVFPNTVDCSCAKTEAEISKNFSRVPSPSTELLKFFLRGNALVKEIPDGVFRDVSFEHIIVNNTALRKIHPNALLPSKDRLVELTIQYSLLEDFPFQFLPKLSRLRFLHLQTNSLTSVPAIKSASLEVLSLSFNHISRIEESGWETPNLKFLLLSLTPNASVCLNRNKISKLDEAVFRPMLEALSHGDGSINVHGERERFQV
ncbi:unnamed protein product [Darwinula stevensoni]|uniref:Uncharacterized protein n=1 Tax=Darwinula stevensoni TaxID=69355 RepID=A0A7R8X6T9_9CRUS|nr:unnamed protein product [Darwinula stevensoni]CAG0886251.1 unnamed protein product [Darwinula stevensoni]